MAIRRTASLRTGQFRHLIRVASITGRMPERDVMLLFLTHTTGIRVTELALLIGDALYPSGAIRPEVYLRAEITKGRGAKYLPDTGQVPRQHRAMDQCASAARMGRQFRD